MAVISSPRFSNYREPRAPVCRLRTILEKSSPTTPAIPTTTSSRISSTQRADCHGRSAILASGATLAVSTCWNSSVDDPRAGVEPRQGVRHRQTSEASLRLCRVQSASMAITIKSSNSHCALLADSRAENGPGRDEGVHMAEEASPKPPGWRRAWPSRKGQSRRLSSLKDIST